MYKKIFVTFSFLIYCLAMAGCLPSHNRAVPIENNIKIIQGSNVKPQYLIRPTAVTIDSKGNIYVLDRYSVNGFIKKYSSKGKYLTRFASLGEGSSQLQTPLQIAVDNLGNLYVTDAGGISGVKRKRKVQKYNKENKFEKTLVSFPETSAQTGYYGPAGIHIQGGDIYLTNVDRIEKVNSQGKITREFGMGQEGKFGFFLSDYIEGPSSLSVDTNGNVYVLDTYSGLIKIFNPQGKLTKQIQPRKVEVSEPLEGDLEVVGNSLYFLDFRLAKLTKFTLQGKTLWQVGSSGKKNNQFFNPTDIDFDRLGNIYVADSGNRCIKVLNSKGELIKIIGKAPENIVFFSQPGEVAIDSKNNLYIADTANNRVVEMNSQDKVIGIIRGENSPLSVLGDNQGTLYYPGGLAVDGKNNIYVADYDYNRKQKFNQNGKLIATFGPAGDITLDRKDNIYLGNGSYLTKLNQNFKVIMKSENAKQESLYNQGNLVVDSQGFIYMVDRINSMIKKFSSSGKLVKTFGEAGSKKGQLLYPNGIALGKDNNIYIANSGNHRIEVFNRNGKYLRNMGKFGSRKEEFNFPQGITFDAAGNMYVADTGNQRIVKISRRR